MDKRIIDALVDAGYITATGVNPDHYKDVNDLIDKGILTVTASREIFENIIASIDDVEILEPINEKDEPVLEVLLDEKPIDVEPVEELSIIDETPESPEVIVDTPADETPLEEVQPEEPTVTEETTPEEPTVTEETTKKKKSTKKSE